ncbi:hypothetical protein Gobs01_04524 [Geodermatophilus obscurus DSM 43160]|uniref:Permease family protein n=1 Tax=Geodermatophilus obscurus (strain ATCC 25078 / DSM 43160 / JCM 3152 / CCUG 61914 / KCC A-0152 / KCTC 9177 / NBRC 13315 / NRRL B-3577 / G-20) TaxID=526225 RepID=D2S7K8_GEOOG|nr:hypothetical protein Gobs_2837 [Geodermatophilus obscurus DSM 43160]
MALWIKKGTAGAADTGVHPVDEVLPPGPMVAYGLRHVLSMYAGVVAVPLIVGTALELAPRQISSTSPSRAGSRSSSTRASAPSRSPPSCSPCCSTRGAGSPTRRRSSPRPRRSARPTRGTPRGSSSSTPTPTTRPRRGRRAAPRAATTERRGRRSGPVPSSPARSPGSPARVPPGPRCSRRWTACGSCPPRSASPWPRRRPRAWPGSSCTTPVRQVHAAMRGRSTHGSRPSDHRCAGRPSSLTCHLRHRLHRRACAGGDARSDLRRMGVVRASSARGHRAEFSALQFWRAIAGPDPVGPTEQPGGVPTSGTAPDRCLGS